MLEPFRYRSILKLIVGTRKATWINTQVAGYKNAWSSVKAKMKAETLRRNPSNVQAITAHSPLPLLVRPLVLLY